MHVSSPPTKLPPVLPPQPEKPKRLAGYTVIEIINSRSYGDVYKVSKKDSGDLLAVKVMLKCRQTAWRTEEQQRELSIMKKLSGKHPNIMNLLGWRETKFNFQLFMPLYDQTLKQFINGSPVPLHAGQVITTQLCSAVTYLHESIILHRDIKPANILMKRKNSRCRWF